MHAYVNSWLSHDGARNQPALILSLFLLKYVFIFVNKPIHPCNFFVLANFLQVGEGSQ